MQDPRFNPALALDGEAWGAFPDNPDYLVSTFGRIASLKTGEMVLKPPQKDGDGYLHVTLSYKGDGVRKSRIKTVKIQRMVLETFVGPRPHGMVGCHNDGKKLNNRLDNLRWDTPKANERDKVAHGTQVGPAGEINGMSRLKTEDVLRVHELRARGLSHAKIGREMGISREHARDICNGKCWGHVQYANRS